MQHSLTHQRSVQKKWSMTLHKNSAIHQSGLVLPPGNWEAFDPFLLMGEDNMKKGAYEYHPHRGIETVTYVIDGILEHRDNLGNKGQLKKGDTQWMTAGKGLLHLEDAPAAGFAHVLQLWVNLPAKDKMVAPRYQDIYHNDLPVNKMKGAEIRVISGSSGDAVSSTVNYATVIMLEIEIERKQTIKHDLSGDFNGFIYVLSGSGIFGKNKVPGEKNDVLWLSQPLDERSEVEITANDPLKFLLIAGIPLGEPIVAKGPFVMNTEPQISEAYQDFRAGKFGNWIHDEKL